PVPADAERRELRAHEARRRADRVRTPPEEQPVQPVAFGWTNIAARPYDRHRPAHATGGDRRRKEPFGPVRVEDLDPFPPGQLDDRADAAQQANRTRFLQVQVDDA